MNVYWTFEAIRSSLLSVERASFELSLGESEKAYYQTLRFNKRRVEWLAGRLALKKLLRAVEPDFAQYKEQQLEILKAENGAPYLCIDGERLQNHSISISHSNGFLLCAYSPEESHLGMDLERIEPRPQPFVQDFFTPAEVRLVELCPPQEAAQLATLIWSAKESILKALSIGLKVDTRSIEVDTVSQTCSQEEWNLIRFTSAILNENSLRLYWRREENFVLTACIEEGRSIELIRV